MNDYSAVRLSNKASLFDTLTYAFMPADPGQRGVVIEAGPNWSYDTAVFTSEADVVVWGRMPDGLSPTPMAARRAVAREIALRMLYRRTPPRLRITAIHRLPPRQLGTSGFRHSLRETLRGGLMVELTSLPAGTRILDAVAIAAGANCASGSIHIGAGGTMLTRIALTDGSIGLLRLAQAGAPGDPAHHGDTLKQLATTGVPLAPRLRGQGQTAGASWTVEELLSGYRPVRATAQLARQVAEICAHFPRAEGPPTALTEDLLEIAIRLPEWADALRQLARDLTGMVKALPGILRHGDLWAGNLLVEGEVLTGMIDWDAAHPAAVPGADLLQLIATEIRRQAGQALGLAFLNCPWRSDAFRTVTTDYWSTIGTQPDRTLFEIIGIAWWTREVCGTLSRFPHRARDERWLAANVDSVLASLGY